MEIECHICRLLIALFATMLCRPAAMLHARRMTWAVACWTCGPSTTSLPSRQCWAVLSPPTSAHAHPGQGPPLQTSQAWAQGSVSALVNRVNALPQAGHGAFVIAGHDARSHHHPLQGPSSRWAPTLYLPIPLHHSKSPFPTCLPTHPTFPTPTPQFFIGSNQVACYNGMCLLHSEARYSCDAGWAFTDQVELRGGFKAQRCKADGSWSAPPPSPCMVSAFCMPMFWKA